MAARIPDSLGAGCGKRQSAQGSKGQHKIADAVRIVIVVAEVAAG
jgi:hypothetical protein